MEINMSKAQTITDREAEESIPESTNSRPEAKAEVLRSGAAVSPRAGTKQALVVALLSRPAGATLSDLSAATEWLPHTTRAALTGLRQRGFAIARQSGSEGASVYLIPAAEPQPAVVRKRRSARRRVENKAEASATV